MMGFNSETWTVSDGSPRLPSQRLWGQSHLRLRAPRLKSRGGFGSPHRSDSRCSRVPGPSTYPLTILSTRRLRQRHGRHRGTGLTPHRSERLKIYFVLIRVNCSFVSHQSFTAPMLDLRGLGGFAAMAGFRFIEMEVHYG